MEVAHEALIRAWPRSHSYDRRECRDDLRTRQRISRAASDWDEGGGDGSLWRGALLATALEWAATNPGALNEHETAFLRRQQNRRGGPDPPASAAPRRGSRFPLRAHDDRPRPARPHGRKPSIEQSVHKPSENLKPRYRTGGDRVGPGPCRAVPDRSSQPTLRSPSRSPPKLRQRPNRQSARQRKPSSAHASPSPNACATRR